MWPQFLESAAALALVGSALALDWQTSAVNVSMCNWDQFRANIIHDTIYLDGGSLWWQVGLSDGQDDPPQEDNIDGLVYTLNLGQPFDQTTNLTTLFQALNKTGGLASKNTAPTYIDGVMFANDDELILYGGLTVIDSQEPLAANAILGYEAFPYGPERASWAPGFIETTLPQNVTRYVTNGAGVSAPSENLGFYFSGMRAQDWGLIQDIKFANTTANTLITVDMSVMGEETWTNDTLPDNILGRANAELVWLPVSESGALVAIGGVIYPESLTAARELTDAEAAASSRISPTFMETVSVYDVANKRWYQQNTTGDIPPQLTLFCSVVAAAQDGSSFNIYIYGGYNGINATDIPSDDVYVLSVPSFTWIKVYDGQVGHGRTGHKCIKVYPDQMFVIGGVYIDPSVCLDGGIIQVFNLNTVTFQDSYNPENWSDYEVPATITARIGGDGKGNATKTAPSAWNDDGLSSLFATKYTKPIATYYPYKPVNSSTPTPSPTPTGPVIVQQKSSSGFPGWAGAIIGVLLGMLILVSLIAGCLLYRRRKLGSGYGSNATGHRSWIMNWLYATHRAKSSMQTASELGNTEKDLSGTASRAVSPISRTSIPREAASLPVHELETGTSTRFELPTEFNTPANYHPPPHHYHHRHTPSLDSVLYGSTDRAPSESGDSEASSQSTRPAHRYQNSDLSSSPLSDISELPSEESRHSRHISDVSGGDADAEGVISEAEGDTIGVSK
ncbi:hypothetical protein VTN77DRAFT_1934 [Rasamsonia byssochlamydoides]|uniref:uncharacterized protein n=1 Tax=Rasamsonia byssochlamydoides TaxID=89139 RepID=UPI003742BC41